MTKIEVSKRTVEQQDALVIRKTITRAQIAQTIGESLPRVFAYAQKVGAALVGSPFARYPAMGAETLEIEVGMPTADKVDGEGDIEAIAIPESQAAFAIHTGPYATLFETHEAVAQWMREHDLAGNGPPLESYVTDPGTHPDPREWRTEIFHPVA